MFEQYGFQNANIIQIAFYAGVTMLFG